MQTWRKLIGVVAILGVLLHAGLIVQHASMLVGAVLGQSLAGDLQAAICHGGDAATADAAVPQDGDGSGRPAAGQCPICQGMSSAAVVLPTPLPLAARAEAESERLAAISERIAHRIAGLLPPARAPPSRA